MAAPRKYRDELRERATRMAVELRQDPETEVGGDRAGRRPARDASARRCGTGSGRPRSMAASGPGTTTSDAQRLARARAGEPRAAAGQRDLEDGLGFLRGGARPPHQQVVAYIDAHRHDVVDGREVGVEPICAVLKDGRRADRPEHLLRRQDQAAVGARDPRRRAGRRHQGRPQGQPRCLRRPEDPRRAQPRRHRGRPVHRGTADAAEGLRGIPREKTRKTTIGDGAETERPEDLVKRKFVADRAEPAVGGRPDLRPHARRLDLRRVRPRRLQPDDRRLAGVHLVCAPTSPWTPSTWACGPGSGPARTSPAWSITATAESNIERFATPSGSPKPRPSRRSGAKGDSYDNAMAEALNSLFKAECIRNPVMRPKGGWKSVTRRRDRRRRVRRLVQPPTPTRRDRPRPTRRVRDQPLGQHHARALP